MHSLYFPNLDIIRFIAAFYVLFYHIYVNVTSLYGLPYYLTEPNGNNFRQSIVAAFSHLDMFIKNGPFGVDLFFLISGFLITSLLLNEKARSGTLGIGSFYLRRTLRIWPLYYFIIGLAWLFAHYYTHEHLTIKDIYPHLAFVSNFTMISTSIWSPGKLFLLWSICIEEQFYLIIPLIIFLVPIRKLPFIFTLLILISIIIRVVLFYTHTYPWFAIYFHTGSRFDTLALGCLLGYLNHSGVKIKLLHWQKFLTYLLMFTAFAFINGFYYDQFMHAVFFKYIFILPMSVLFFDAIQNILPTLNGVPWKILNFLGKYSYGIYMYQLFTIVVADRWAISFFSKSRLAFVLLSVLLTVVVSIISYEIFEKQFLRLKRTYGKV